VHQEDRLARAVNFVIEPYAIDIGARALARIGAQGLPRKVADIPRISLPARRYAAPGSAMASASRMKIMVFFDRDDIPAASCCHCFLSKTNVDLSIEKLSRRRNPRDADVTLNGIYAEFTYVKKI
jgi:hypothetical protein